MPFENLYQLRTARVFTFAQTPKRGLLLPTCPPQGLGAELTPFGFLPQALSQRDPPHNNFFFFDGMKGNGIVECLGPK